MTEVERLRSLIERTPVLVIDLAKAEAAGDVAALRYHRAIAAWREEAAVALREAEAIDVAPCMGGHGHVGGLNPSGPLRDRIAELVTENHAHGCAG